MNIAILMAQSEYKNEPKLTACKNDLRLVKNVIEKSKKYNDILVLDDSVGKALDANEKIIQFLGKYKDGSSVDEILLYFSGHGNFVDNEFYYVWGDYDESKKRQTCLLNSEVDSFLKSLNAKLTVKIVDACQSGVPYLKGGEEFNKFLNTSKDSFNKCYFLFSSQNDESSKADSQISFFTKSILNSLNSFDVNQTVRYKDIMNFVSDEFERTKIQTPFFVIQSDYTDSFIEMNSDIKLAFNTDAFKVLSKVATEDHLVNNSANILDLIKKDAEKYVSFDSVKECLENFKEVISREKLDSFLSELYALEINDLSYRDIPQIKEIGKWIQEKGKSTYTQLYFKSVPYTVKVPKNKLNFLAAAFSYNEDDYKTETQYREEIDYFSNTLEIPYMGLNILFRGKFSNLMNFSLCMVPILTRTSLFLFLSKVDYKRSGWDDQIMEPSSVKWEYKDEQTAMNDVGKNAFHKVEQGAIDILKTRFSLKETAD